MQKKDAIDIRTGRPVHARAAGSAADEYPAVPALPETLLLLELRSHELSIDLGVMAALVLSDPGATLEVLRLAAREHEEGEERPVRIEDCISGLGVQACLAAVGQEAVAAGGWQCQLPEVWAHAREVALACHARAAGDGEVHPEEAYLVGLLHGLGSLPQVLGWSESPSGPRHAGRAAVLLAEQWSLPPCVEEFCRAWESGEIENRWVRLLYAAHPRAGRSPQSCPLATVGAPRLRRVL